MRHARPAFSFASFAFALPSLAFAAALLGGGCSGDDTASTSHADGGTDASMADASPADSAPAEASTDAAADAALAISCDNYCTLAMLNCTATNAIYVDKGTCLSMCANMTLGTAPDTSNDTVACRQSYAQAAAMNPSTNCPIAGLTGGDTCGTSHCKAWCAQDVAVCGTTAFATKAACETACASFTYSTTSGDIAATTGNTMNCRIYHVEKAAQNAGALKATHCPHTGSPSINMDGTPGPCQ
jgi:hypothetical protein